MHVAKGLFIKPQWIELILADKKTWEMRSTSTAHRGWFALVGSGTGRVWGIANLIGVGRSQSEAELIAALDKHQIPESMIRSGEVAKWTTPWIIGEARRLPTPIPTRAKGQLWVNLEPSVSEAIAEQVGKGVEVPESSVPNIASAQLPSLISREVPIPAVVEGSGVMGETELTEGNIRPKNSHFYLRGFVHRFPSDLIGGRDVTPPRLARIESDGMSSTMTDICPRHHFFRDRSWTREFLANSDAVPGDVVRVEEAAPYRYRVSLRKR